MARTLDEILADFKGIYYQSDLNPRQEPQEYVRDRMPKFLQQSNNDEFYEFLRKMFSYYRDKVEFWIWILEGQFCVLTAKAGFLDNLGRWLGLSRPPLPQLRTTEPVVIYPSQSYIEEDPLLAMEFGELHNLSDITGEGTTGTFYPAKDFVGETLVDDSEYRVYIQGMLMLKSGISFDIIMEVYARILTKPFFVYSRTADSLIIHCHYEEDSVRVTIIRDINSKLRTTGFNIELEQSQEEKPEWAEKIYGEGCWDQDPAYTDYGEDTTTLVLSESSIILREDNTYEVFATTDADEVSIIEQTPEIATATVDGKTITIKGITAGEARFIVYAKATDRYQTSRWLYATIESNETILEASVDELAIVETQTSNIAITTSAATYTATSDNENITLTQNGNTLSVTGVTAGSAVITITAQRDTYREATITIPVTIAEIQYTEISADVSSVDIMETNSQVVNVTTNADSITATTSDASVATYTINGKVLTINAVGAGSANITISAQADLHLESSIVIPVNVTEMPMTELETSVDSIQIMQGGEDEIVVTTNASSFAASVNNSYATTSVNGNTVSITVGTTLAQSILTIEAQADGCKKATKEITIEIIEKETTSLSVSPASISVSVGGTSEAISVTTNADTYNVIVSDTSIARYDSTTRQVIGVKAGSTRLEVVAQAKNHYPNSVYVDIQVT